MNDSKRENAAELFFRAPPVVSTEEAREAAERELQVYLETGVGTPTVMRGSEWGGGR